MGVERIPDEVRLPPAESLALAQRLLDDAMPFHAHEVLEGTWKISDADERTLWQGLAQLAVGLTHLMRGNLVGARSLLTQGRDRIGSYPHDPARPDPHDIDIAGLMRWADGLVETLDRGDVPEPEVPRLTRGPLFT